MGQAWTATRLAAGGIAGPTLKASSMAGPTGWDLWSCSGPVSNVSDGSVVTISSDLAAKCYGAVIVGQDASNIQGLAYRILLSTGTTRHFSTTTMKIQTITTCTGVALQSDDISAEQLYIMRYIG